MFIGGVMIFEYGKDAVDHPFVFRVELVETGMWKIVARALNRPYQKVVYSDLRDGGVGLARKLVLLGDDHAKCMRMIMCGLTIQAPRYWWMEFDTYRLGRFSADMECLSESTMHRPALLPFAVEDFEKITPETLAHLNSLLGSPNLIERKQALPEAFLQTRDVVLNYQALRHIYCARKNHHLPHWRAFCDFIKNELPYASELIIAE